MSDDRKEKLRQLVYCGGSRKLDERRVCFGQILRLFNDWPPCQERSDALRETDAALDRTSDVFRETIVDTVMDADGRTARDTAILVRSVLASYPEDTARSTSMLSRLLGSAHARKLRRLQARNADFSLDVLARGPGGERLLSLSLSASLPPVPGWERLHGWPGLRTLQALSVIGSPGAVQGPALFELLAQAPDFHDLELSSSGSEDAIAQLHARPALAHRIDWLVLQCCGLTDASVDALIAATALDHLLRIDLRHNDGITRDAIARLSRAPQFARTDIVAGPHR